MKTTFPAAFPPIFLIIMLASPATIADDKPALKTTTDKITIPKSVVEFTLVQLPAGKITIKDANGKDKEYDIKPIWIGKTEVTWDEFDVWWLALEIPEADRPAEFIKSRPSRPFRPPQREYGHDGLPAGSMFCKEAKRYCEWLSKMTGHKYRLPTEAEWEYACRCGGPPLKPTKAELRETAWYESNSDERPHHVAEKKPNAWGLYDMLGNIAEWVIKMDGTEAVAGGSFRDGQEDVTSAAREPYSKAWQKTDPQDPQGKSWLSDGMHVGFRVVRED